MEEGHSKSKPASLNRLDSIRSSVTSTGEESTYEDNFMSSYFNIYGDNDESDADMASAKSIEMSLDNSLKRSSYEDKSTSIDATPSIEISHGGVAKSITTTAKNNNENYDHDVSDIDTSYDQYGTHTGKFITDSSMTQIQENNVASASSSSTSDPFNSVEVGVGAAAADESFKGSLYSKKPLIFTKIVESKFEDSSVRSLRSSIDSSGDNDNNQPQSTVDSFLSPLYSETRTIKFEDEANSISSGTEKFSDISNSESNKVQRGATKRHTSMNPLKSILRYRNSMSSQTSNSSGGGAGHRKSGDSSRNSSYSYAGASDLIKSEKFTRSAIANYDKLVGGVDELVAAAAVVASSSLASSRPVVHFSVGEKCLVILAILNGTLPRLRGEEEHQNVTKNPVNKFGFPRGLGFAIEEQRGPYNYVLCNVKAVHFDEDARYYTITRIDMGIDQRAEPEWMEPMLTEEGKIAALKATTLNEYKAFSKTQEIQLRKRHPIIEKLSFIRKFLKRQATLCSIGNLPYAIRFQFSGINFLVLASLVFNFLDQIRLLIPNPRNDKLIGSFLVAIWFILITDLVCEVCIRPSDYQGLVRSKDKYDPSTACFINRFHVITESITLLCFLPEIISIFSGWDKGSPGSLLQASLSSVSVEHSLAGSYVGLITYAVIRLRVICLIRYWKTHWLNHNYINLSEEIDEATKGEKSKIDINETSNSDNKPPHTVSKEDEKLKNAAHIGTALMMTKSHRSLILMIIVYATVPFFYHQRNYETDGMTYALQSSNVVFPGSDNINCTLLQESSMAWLESMAPNPNTRMRQYYSGDFLLYAQVLPVRCPFQEATGGVITLEYPLDDSWGLFNANSTAKSVANTLGLRVGVIQTISESNVVNGQEYSVTAMYNQEQNIIEVNLYSIILQATLLLLVLIDMRLSLNDVIRLVLGPLHRMLRIVLRYSKNPLATAPKKSREKKRASTIPFFMKTQHISGGSSVVSEATDSELSIYSNEGELGTLESQILINTVSKITDLLRKCWGVAGANIISSNLARQQSGTTVAFSPLVQGKAVYALFAFAAINDFSTYMRNLEQDIMILINDVASVVHDEVFRWGYGTSGQCNKNLGSCFLLVFRIGEFEQVRANKKKATKVIFSDKTKVKVKKATKRKIVNKWSETVVLASLPGIADFTDRALLGMLKSFAGINRSEKLRVWKDDFRLGAGVGAFSVDMIFGMDAGWAVEGAVGSEFKVDATYLSPHVNMASRMMSACKQFGVTILLSQAIEELFSPRCRTKLRHLDTVTVKGSAIKQKIFTYDARELGVNFFLHSRTDNEANIESELCNQEIWDTDQDLCAMRQHVSDEFMEAFKAGRDSYLAGRWKDASAQLKKADEIMIQTVMDGGYLAYDADEFEYSLSREEKEHIYSKIGDGPSRCLLAYVNKRNETAPDNWDGYRPLTSK